jgi:glucan 1,3-beta-glucosidase
MSARYDRLFSLGGVDFSKTTQHDLASIFRSLLNQGLHGICFSAYEEGQKPGDILSEAQIRRRMEIIKPYTKWVRTFSCTEGNELIAKVAHEYGIKTMVGAWLSGDKELNKAEIDGLYEVAGNGWADLVAVGNEVLYRKELTEDELLTYIEEAKDTLPEVGVGYVDAYYEFYHRPQLADACDVIFANCYPFWEGCPIEHSFLYMKDMYRKASEAAKGKRVIISETGWPNKGTAFEGSIPSIENAMKYFINAQKWSREENVEMFYFSSFDEAWKTGDEGDVGAYWGIWDKQGDLKY